jgi:predicted DNA-binding transcriptional regulator AlpA
MIINPDDQVVTERQAAEFCGISLDTLRRRIKAGNGPKRLRLSTHRIGYRLRAAASMSSALRRCAAARSCALPLH